VTDAFAVAVTFDNHVPTALVSWIPTALPVPVCDATFVIPVGARLCALDVADFTPTNALTHDVADLCGTSET
jgi:hypothetical protein